MRETKQYLKNRISYLEYNNKEITRWLIVFAILSLISSGLFMYTGSKLNELRDINLKESEFTPVEECVEYVTELTKPEDYNGIVIRAEDYSKVLEELKDDPNYLRQILCLKYEPTINLTQTLNEVKECECVEGINWDGREGSVLIVGFECTKQICTAPNLTWEEVRR